MTCDGICAFPRSDDSMHLPQIRPRRLHPSEGVQPNGPLPHGEKIMAVCVPDEMAETAVSVPNGTSDTDRTSDTDGTSDAGPLIGTVIRVRA